jgi:hypothetical protein
MIKKVAASKIFKIPLGLLTIFGRFYFSIVFQKV